MFKTRDLRKGLRDRDRSHRRAGGAPHLQRQADEQELVDLRRSQLLQVQVFDDEDARANQKQQVAWQGDLEIWIGRRADVESHVVRTDGPDLLVDEPAAAGRVDARSLQV